MTGFEKELFWASASGRAVDVLRWVKGGVNLEAMDENGRTPLHCAAAHNNHFVVFELLASGANIHAKDELGTSTLHLAALRPFGGETTAIVRLLIERGADVEAKDAHGHTPLSLLVKLATTSDDSTPMLKMRMKSGQPTALTLISFGADPCLMDPESAGDLYTMPALHAAVRMNDVKRVKALIERGDDIDVVHLAESAFEAAERIGEQQVLALLQARKAAMTIDRILSVAGDPDEMGMFEATAAPTKARP